MLKEVEKEVSAMMERVKCEKRIELTVRQITTNTEN